MSGSAALPMAPLDPAEPEAAPVEGLRLDVEAVRGSSFYWGMRILPRPRREAIFAVYAFCRAVDDVADEEGPLEGRLARLRGWREGVDAACAGRAPAGLAPLAAAVSAYGLRRSDLQDVIDGVEMDVVSTIRAPDWTTLELYCDRVASAVGRLCTPIFGMAEAPGLALADDLGKALQLTNTLRDVDEDAERGRVYLPREALREAGIETTEPAAVVAHPALEAACRRVAGEAARRFAKAEATMAACPRAQTRAPRIMAGAYRLLLDDLLARGWAAPRTRVRLGRRRLLGMVLRRGIA